MRPLSESLTDLANRAKTAEDNYQASRAETKEQIDARIDEARASAERFRKEVEQEASDSTQQTKSQWNDLKARVANSMEKMRTDAEARNRAFAARRSEQHAESAEEDANAAVAIAIAAIDDAYYAVLNATAARQEADLAPAKK
ncbi:MAG: YtxH domain-containing protein [Chloroflexi bacterium]|nr:MAG: YtxH domain-containing protein [Chloroflexota bacterium]